MLEKIIDLESKIAFLENNTAELSDVIYQQQKQIDQLVKMVERLSARLQSATDDAIPDQNPEDEKPPHY